MSTSRNAGPIIQHATHPVQARPILLYRSTSSDILDPATTTASPSAGAGVDVASAGRLDDDTKQVTRSKSVKFVLDGKSTTTSSTRISIDIESVSPTKAITTTIKNKNNNNNKISLVSAASASVSSGLEVHPTALESTAETTDMRFTSPLSRPSLTPLGYKLLHLSEVKLANLESPLGGREEGEALWKEVVVRQAVKSAWESVDQGSVNNLTDWSAKGAMGLDVIGEEEDEEMYGSAAAEGMLGRDDGGFGGRQHQAWFDNLINSFGEDEHAYTSSQRDEETHQAHEWAESSVETPFDDLEYDDEGMEAYTLPSIISAPSPTSSPIVGPLSIPTVPTMPVEVPGVDEMQISVGPAAAIIIEEEGDEADEEADIIDTDMVDALVDANEPRDASIQPVFLPIPEDSYSTASIRRRRWVDGQRPGDNLPKPIQPILFPLASPPTPMDESCDGVIDGYLHWRNNLAVDDLDECVEDFMLPPPLHRSWSSTSANTVDSLETVDDAGDVCVTPKSEISCEELEECVVVPSDVPDLEEVASKGESTSVEMGIGLRRSEVKRRSVKAKMGKVDDDVMGDAMPRTKSWLELVVDQLEGLET